MRNFNILNFKSIFECLTYQIMSFVFMCDSFICDNCFLDNIDKHRDIPQNFFKHFVLSFSNENRLSVFAHVRGVKCEGDVRPS